MVSNKIICTCQGKILDKEQEMVYDTGDVKENTLTKEARHGRIGDDTSI